MNGKRKLILMMVAAACAVSLCIGGTLMFLTDTTEIATNVVTLANKPLSIKLQETGWADWNHNNTVDYKEESLPNDSDGDFYWEFTTPGDSDISDGPYPDGEGDFGYKDIVAGEFLGIEYPSNLIPNETIYKAPRVVHVSGVNAYLRVLAKVTVKNSDGDDASTDLSKTFSGLYGNAGANDFRYIRYDSYGNMIDSSGNTTNIQNNAIVDCSEMTLKSFIQSLFASANTNQFNWEYEPEPSSNSLEGYYYYVNNGQNPETLSEDGKLGLTSTGDTSFEKNDVPLAEFGDGGANGEIATAPLFTSIKIPVFTNAMQSILSRYEISVQFQAQAVQAEGNGNGMDWEATFFELENAISAASPTSRPYPYPTPVQPPN
ncbi:MAG: hypothetical protein LBU32_00325 [Clostridiales bacterium]|jgi:predicted ribosomally synthesized peptide with SipW-like signal peptide|nr:hypothetical protein [Clostridiales bacterium]